MSDAPRMPPIDLSDDDLGSAALAVRAIASEREDEALRFRALEPEKLVERLGAGARIGDVKARLKCPKCDCTRSEIKPVFLGKRRD